MNDEPKDEPRSYRSELRADQARATRARIIDAVKTLIGEGNRELAYTQIAKAARVSVPTVYRHFPTRPELFEGLYAAVELTQVPTDASFSDADMLHYVRAFFQRFDDPDGVYAKSTRLNAMWEFSRATTVPRRRALLDAYIANRAPHLEEPQRTWLLDLGVVLFSSAMSEAMRGYLDRTGVETADRVLFAFDALFTHANSLTQSEKT